MIDIAIHSGARPVSARALASRHRLPPRHLEPVLQALVHFGILKGIRGPHVGYELAREDRSISAADILRAADSMDEADKADLPGSALADELVVPLLAEAEQTLLTALARVSVAELTRRAEGLE